MKTFRFTVPEPGLTKHEKEGKKKKQSLGHSDYIRAFIGFWILATVLSYALAFLTSHISSDSTLITIAILILILSSSYLSFYWATKHLLVGRLKVDQDDADNPVNPPLKL